MNTTLTRSDWCHKTLYSRESPKETQVTIVSLSTSVCLLKFGVICSGVGFRLNRQGLRTDKKLFMNSGNFLVVFSIVDDSGR